MLLPYVIAHWFWYPVLNSCKWSCYSFCLWAGSPAGSARVGKRDAVQLWTRFRATWLPCKVHSNSPETYGVCSPSLDSPLKSSRTNTQDATSLLKAPTRTGEAQAATAKWSELRQWEWARPPCPVDIVALFPQLTAIALSDLVSPFGEKNALVLTQHFSCADSKYFAKVEQHPFIRLSKWGIDRPKQLLEVPS